MKHMSHTPHIYVDLVRVTLPYMSHIIGVLNCSLQNKAHCKTHCCSWEDIPHVHFTDRVILAAYRCIEEDNCLSICSALWDNYAYFLPT